MDTGTHTHRTAALLVVLALLAFAGPLDRTDEARPIVISGGDAAQERTVDWALRRFRAAGLDGMPPLDIHLHGSSEGCNGSGNRGYYRDGRIDLCTAEASEPYARKFALHEIAHAWAEANVDAETRARFMRLRGIETWNDGDVPWKERGHEQVAEVIAWGLGEGEIAPQLDELVDTQSLIDGYVLLTGLYPITAAVAAA